MLVFLELHLVDYLGDVLGLVRGRRATHRKYTACSWCLLKMSGVSEDTNSTVSIKKLVSPKGIALSTLQSILGWGVCL